MCYHASVSATYSQLEEAYERPFLGDQFPGFYHKDEMVAYHLNGFDFPQLPVIAMDQPEKIQLFRWGLIPAWTKDYLAAKQIRAQTLNAKSETALEKASFKIPILKQRCLVLATGFFEWKEVGSKTKIPYFIHLKNRRIFAFAGLFDYWFNPAEDQVYQTFSILTTQANTLMASIHNTKMRMPIILKKEEEERWLNANLMKQEIQSCLHPNPEDEMQAYTISGLISSRKHHNNVPEVLIPYSYEQPDLFSGGGL